MSEEKREANKEVDDKTKKKKATYNLLRGVCLFLGIFLIINIFRSPFSTATSISAISYSLGLLIILIPACALIIFGLRLNKNKQKIIIKILGVLLLIFLFISVSSLSREEDKNNLKTENEGSESSNVKDGEFNLNTVSKEINSQTPIEVDGSTTLITTTVENSLKEGVFTRKLIYTFFVDFSEEMKNQKPDIIPRVKEEMKTPAIDTLCTDSRMDIFRKNNVTLKYEYFDKGGNYLFEFEINNNDC